MWAEWPDGSTVATVITVWAPVASVTLLVRSPCDTVRDAHLSVCLIQGPKPCKTSRLTYIYHHIMSSAVSCGPGIPTPRECPSQPSPSTLNPFFFYFRTFHISIKHMVLHYTNGWRCVCGVCAVTRGNAWSD